MFSREERDLFRWLCGISRHVKLTSAQRIALNYFSLGCPKKAVAERLGISVGSYNDRLRAIRNKYGLEKEDDLKVLMLVLVSADLAKQR